MIKLIYQRDDMHHEYTMVNRIEMEIDSGASLSEMLSAYREFLLSVGYSVDGNIEVVDEEA